MKQHEKKKKSGRGFASMSHAERREIASLGGKEAHRLKKAHEWTHEEAVLAGRKGGAVTKEYFKKKKIDQALQKIQESA